MKARLVTLAAAATMAGMLGAAPAVKVDPVAENYPDWQGITAKGYIAGREISPSDLRHKVTIVIEIAPNEKLDDNFLLASRLVQRTGISAGIGFGANWEDSELPRNVIAVVSVRNARHEVIQEALKPKKTRAQEVSSAVATMSGQGCSFYDDVTYTGAPDNGGKLPYVYVMGPVGREPLFKGELNAAGVTGALAAIAAGRKMIDGWEHKWRPFFGNIAEPKFNTTLAKALEKGKRARKMPLDPIAKALLSDVKSKDEEKATEAQILFDAINQTRSDLLLRIQMEVSACPHRAYYDVQTLLKYWPAETKRLEGVYAKMKVNPDAETLGKIFTKLMEWSDPNFTCKSEADAKKIVVELNKIKKALAGPKESKAIVVQNGAIRLDSMVDELIPQIPSKVSAK